MDRSEQELFQLLEKGTSGVMVVQEAQARLDAAGFEELTFQQIWGLQGKGKYYVKHHDTTLFAFTIGEKLSYDDTIRIGAAHTDFPCLRLKPNPDLAVGGYAQVNVEVYGGAILNTWLDRPLSISGRVALSSEDVMHPRMRNLSVERTLGVIPNLAIHMDRQVNKGKELNKQTDLLPILGFAKEGEEYAFLAFLAEELSVKPEEILDYELWVYCREKPQYAGLHEELILSPRLDNLTSVQALLTGIIESERQEGINVVALFDHEEVGSRTKQGAGSILLNNLLERILDSLGRTPAQAAASLYDAFFLSVDVAHGMHPNQMGKTDLTNKPILGKGLCIKEASSQSYATDCEAVAVVEQICRKEDIPYQKYVNRSDIPGGGTLGSVASSFLPVKTVDIGVPLLAMHSAVETMGVLDMKALTDLIRAFYVV
ncbi:MAG: M18 family aminopeptidase [Lachnospiraceae bacterium]|jgi:Aspartyl aminopeptidase|nr:M18 family aminopeptidase [Lachnospiraceae bacterium]